MAQVLCEVLAGLRDSESAVAVRDIRGHKYFLRVETGFLARVNSCCYLPVRTVGIDAAKQLALIELPHEADSGVNRLWVRPADLRELSVAI
jgi:hypothetical protein